MNTIFTITKLTFREAFRRKIVISALLLGIAFLVIYGLGVHFIQADFATRATRLRSPETIRNQAFNILVLAGMYVVNFLGIATAALATSDSLAGEIQSGTIQAVVTKPIRRGEVVLGKWLGTAGLLLMYMLLMGGGTLLSMRLITGYSAPNWLAGLSLIYFNCVLIMTLTLAFSSSLSTLATGGAVFGAFGLAFIGGWVERIGSLINNQTAVNLGILSSLLLPNEAMWNKAANLMSSPLISAVGASPFSGSSDPSPAMMVYTGLYLLLTLGVAVWQFNHRDL